MKNYFYLMMTFTLSLIGCGNGKQKMQDDIASAEKKLSNDKAMAPDPQKAAEVIHLYVAYADKYPDDSTSAEYLFRAAEMTNAIHQPAKAIQLLERVIHFQTYSKTPVALFLQGFISENDLHDIVKAKDYYEKFLKQYPDHKLAKDVRLTVNNLGKSPEELIKEFEAKAKEDSVVY